MSVVDVLGPPVTDTTSRDEIPHAWCGASAPTADEPASDETGRNRQMVLFVIAALVVGVGSGWLAARSFGDHVSTEPVSTSRDLPADVAGYAAFYTALNLSGPPDGGSADIWVNRAEAVAGSQIDENLWQVDVAVDALELIDGTYRDTGLQHFAVVVSVADGRPVGTVPPARIPGPRTIGTTQMEFSEPVPDDQKTTAVGFLTEYLTGGGELGRYVANPSEIHRFTRPPYSQVETRVVGANSLGQIRVATSATTAGGITHELVYVLTMAFSGDVWMVDQVSPGA